MAKMNMKQIYAMRARQLAEAAAKAEAEKLAKRKAARRGFFVAKARKAKMAQAAA